MNPTPKLRWVERAGPSNPFYKAVASDGTLVEVKNYYRVLQQWHYYDINYPTEAGEWKDVPLEEEK